MSVMICFEALCFVSMTQLIFDAQVLGSTAVCTSGLAFSFRNAHDCYRTSIDQSVNCISLSLY